jgi:hypothetical protein
MFNSLLKNMSTVSALPSWALFFVALHASAQQRAAYIYPSWETPKILWLTTGDSTCRHNQITANHQAGTLRIYSYRTMGGSCLTIDPGAPPREKFTEEKIVNLSSICAGNNCEEPVQRVELYEDIRNGIDRDCVRNQGTITLAPGGSPVPCAPTDAQDGPLFRYRAVAATAVFPLPNRGNYAGTGGSISVATLLYFYNRNIAEGAWAIQFGRYERYVKTKSVNFFGEASALLAKFYRNTEIELPDYPGVVPISLITLKPSRMVITLNGTVFVANESVFPFASAPTDFERRGRSDIWPRFGGVFDVNLPALPFRQFKVGACVANTDSLSVPGGL